MDLRRLKYFVVLAEERHYGRAAARLFLAQPALSQQIKSLESELGVQLFNRSTRRVDLTPAGERLFARATEILSVIDVTVDEVRRVHAGEEGTVRLAFIGSSTYELMPTLARALATELPNLRLELQGDLLSPEVERSLVEGRSDIGVLRPFPRTDGVGSKVLRREPLVVAVPVNHRLAGEEPVQLASLAGEAFVGYPRKASATGDAVLAACLAAGFEPEMRSVVRETSTLVAFVAAGLGVALVPEGVRNVQIPGVVYLPLADEPGPTLDLVAAWREAAPSGVVQQVLTRLEALVR
ncbi:LysR substrate-binding domain-containing protein [Tessaracoccus sp. Z1128]